MYLISTYIDSALNASRALSGDNGNRSTWSSFQCIKHHDD